MILLICRLQALQALHEIDHISSDDRQQDSCLFSDASWVTLTRIVAKKSKAMGTPAMNVELECRHGSSLMSVTTPHMAHSTAELPGGYMSVILHPAHLPKIAGISQERRRRDKGLVKRPSRTFPGK